MATFRPIGFHHSPQVTMTFVEEEGTGTVKAQIATANHPIPVQLPDTILLCDLAHSTALKVERLLRNYHFYPIYRPDVDTVYFEPIPPENKTWEKMIEIPLPSSDVLCISRQDGRISYAFVNTVATRNCIQNGYTSEFYKTTKITALAESSDGRLVVGNEEGSVYFADKIISTGVTKSICDIIPIFNSHYVIKFKKEAVILDLMTEKVILHIENSSDVLVFNNQTVISHRWDSTFKQTKMVFYKYNKESNGYQEIEKDYPNHITNIYRIPNASSKMLIIESKGTKFSSKEEGKTVLLDLETQESLTIEFPAITRSISNFKKAFLVPGDKLVYGTTREAAVKTYSLKGKEISCLAQAGNWGISDLILLSDGSIMFGTGTTPSGIHITTQSGQIVFSQAQDLTNNQNIQSLTELSNGCVAVRFDSSILILKPRTLEPKNKDYQIEKLKLELRHCPDKLDLYSQLAALYESGSEKQYQVYLSALEAAIKSASLYQARRYYEKARKINPENPEPCHVFLSYLNTTPFKKLRREVLLDLYQLTKDDSKLADLKARKCKNRLIIGEGNFSYVEALLNKHGITHQKLSNSIVATELLSPADEAVSKRVESLMNRGVSILFGINAQHIHETFRGQRFKRIHWNCPFGGTSSSERENFKTVIPNFYLSSSQLQLVGDRIHVTLMQSKSYGKKRQEENPIVFGATNAGYCLIRKRVFGESRYSGYVHVKTGKVEEYSKKEDEVEREFVFEKTEAFLFNPTPDFAGKLKDPSKKNYEVKTDGTTEDLRSYYFECSSDEDSSDYYESD